MKSVKYSLIAVLVWGFPWLATAQSKFDALYRQAMGKDYQAQRNLAFGYETGDQKVPVDPLKGCMWRKVILMSGSQRVNQIDIVSHRISCGKLAQDEEAVALRQAEVLANKLYR
jgi:hypothetical protein